MKNCWEILGIEPTTDISVIKKAYAHLLKNEVSDEEVADFQKVKEAFDEAIKLAKTGNITTELPYADFTDLTGEFVFHNEIDFQQIKEEAQQKIQESMTGSMVALDQALQKLLADKVKRKQLVSWQNFFWDYELVDFEKFQFVQEKMKTVIFERYFDFSQEVFDYLLEAYHLEEIYSEEQVIALKRVFFFPFNLPEEFSEEKKHQYYRLRSLIYENLKNNQYLEVKQLIEDCKKIYSLDPELMTLEGIFLIRSHFYQKDVLKQADLLMQEALCLDPEHHTAYLYHVFLTMSNKNWKKYRAKIKKALTNYYVFDPSIVLGFVYAVLADYETSCRYLFEAPDYLRTTFYKEMEQIFHLREAELHEMGATHDIELSKKRKEEMNKIKQEIGQLKQQEGGNRTLLYWISIIATILFVLYQAAGIRDSQSQIQTKYNDFKSVQSMYRLNAGKNIGMSEEIQDDEESHERYGVIWQLIYEYLDRQESVEKKEAFVASHVDSSYQEVFKQNIQDDFSIREYTYTYVSSKKMENGENWYLISTSLGLNQLIVQVNQSNQIVHIYGEGWDNIASEEFDEMTLKILRNHKDSTIYLTDYFLYNEYERDLALDANIYISLDYYETLLSEIKQLEQDGISMIAFQNGQMFSSHLNNGEYCIVVKAQSGEALIVTFDEEQRVKNIYTTFDDKLAKEEWEVIMTRLTPVNREE